MEFNLYEPRLRRYERLKTNRSLRSLRKTKNRSGEAAISSEQRERLVFRSGAAAVRSEQRERFVFSLS